MGDMLLDTDMQKVTILEQGVSNFGKEIVRDLS